jgi:DNA-binding Xre family transcriptional regulator
VSRGRPGRRLDYRWRLREVMALQGMFSTTDLRPLLADRGIDLSASQVYRLVVDKPERLSLATLMALLDILGCQMTDLIEPISVDAAARPRKVVGGGPDVGVGDFRPVRARIVPEGEGGGA